MRVKDTLNLGKTKFKMRGNLPVRERLELIDAVCDYWKQMGIELKNGKKINYMNKD